MTKMPNWETFMIHYGVGVQVRENYKVVETDEEFFA